jgi:tetraacyldisaccharide-1-P 4'-kinase
MPYLIAGAGGPSERSLEWNPARSDRRDGAVVPTDARVLAVAGIARPERFFEDLTSAGWRVVGTMRFPDHHRFTRQDVERLKAAARVAEAIVMTTEKDAVRLDAHELGTLSVAAVPLTVSIEPAALFGGWLLGRLQAARRTQHRVSDAEHPAPPTGHEVRRTQNSEPNNP